MSRRLYANNLEMILTSDIGLGDTTFTVDDTSRCPTIVPSSGDYFLITVEKPDGSLPREVMKVTDVSGLTLTVVRAQDETPAQVHTIGAAVENRATAGQFADGPQKSSSDEAIDGKWSYSQPPDVAGQDVWNGNNVSSSDTDALIIDNTDPAAPQLLLQTNTASGLAKLDPTGVLPWRQRLPEAAQRPALHGAGSSQPVRTVPNSGIHCRQLLHRHNGWRHPDAGCDLWAAYPHTSDDGRPAALFTRRGRCSCNGLVAYSSRHDGLRRHHPVR